MIVVTTSMFNAQPPSDAYWRSEKGQKAGLLQGPVALMSSKFDVSQKFHNSTK